MSANDTRFNQAYEPLVQRVVTEATVIDSRILKIDHFLNHQIDAKFVSELGREIAERIRPFNPEIILTAEASGIAPAFATALHLGLPVVFAKKYSVDVETPALSRIITSATKGGEVRIVVARRYLKTGMRVAIIDDFLANGSCASALSQIVQEAGALPVVAGFVVEKLFQKGRIYLEGQNIPVFALAQVESLENNQVKIKN